MFLKQSGADGVTPPGFQFPVKELVASLQTYRNMEQQSSYSDFIGVYKNAINPDLCDWLVDYMGKAHQVVTRNSLHVQDKQICLDAFSPGEAQALMDGVNGCLIYYTKKYPYLSNFNYVSSLTLLQQTDPTEGYHIFHGENLNWNASARTMAWMVYLNDVEEGGETEFLYQGIKVKPEKGKVVIWPGSYTHLHRGNPPGSSKFIATGWYQCDIGLDQLRVQAQGIEIQPEE